MAKPVREKIVQIGMGEHTPHTLVRAYLDPDIHLDTLAFVDINEERLNTFAEACRILNRHTGKKIKIETSTDAGDVLEDATVVFLAFAVGYPQLVLEDYARGDKYGIPIVEAETIGIGGGLMGLRHLKVAIPIIEKVKKLCPDAWCVISTNPIRHLTDYAARYAKLPKCMGLCHGTVATLHYLEKVLGAEFGKYDCIVAGANHLIWYLRIWERATGKDFYPELAEILKKRALDGEMGRTLFPIFGLYPGNGPGHVPDAFGFFAREVWEKYTIHRPVTTKNYDPFLDYQKRSSTLDSIHVNPEAAKEGNKRWVGYMRDICAGKMVPADLLKILAEGEQDDPNDRILRTLFRSDTMYYNPALNIPNTGGITNLPEDAIVEIPGVSNRIGAYPLSVGALPEAVAEVTRRQIVIQKLQVDAAATGSKQALVQSLMLDPTVKDIDKARGFLEESLADHPDVYPDLHY